MKWIGQHIYDQISRFRNSVYLEDVSSGTIASGGHLGLDSNNKIVKAVDGGGDITGVALTASTGIDLTSVSGATGGAYAATIGVDVSDFMTNGGNGQVVTSTGTDAMTANSYLQFTNDAGEGDTSTLSISSNQDVGDMFTIRTTTHGATTITTIDDDAAAASLTFNVDGNVYHKNASGISEWYKSGNDDDRFRIAVGTHGDTILQTIDSAAAAAHMTLVPDGDLKLTPSSGTTYFYDASNTSDYLKLDIDSNGGAAFTTVDAAAANAGFTINADGVIEFNALYAINLTNSAWDAQIGSNAMALASSAANGPAFYLQNTADDATGGYVTFVSRREDGGTLQAGEDSDIIGTVKFQGYNDNAGGGGPDLKDYANIIGSIADATNGQEAGNLKLFVASYDGVSTAGLQLLGDTNADGEVDVTVGAGAASTTTVAGTLTMGSTAFVNNSGVVQVATQGTIDHNSLANYDANRHFVQSSITTVGTIGTGVWQGTALATAYIADDAVTFAKASGVSPNVFGNTIKLIPSDFAVNDDGGNQKFGVGYIEVAGTGYGMRSPNSNAELFAFVSIPEGMKATHVNIHAKSTYSTEVFEVQIDDTTVSSKGTGNCNTNLDITDVDATATNFLAIMVSITATTDKVYGGTVTIAAI